MSRPIPQKRLIIEVGDKKNARKSIIGGRLQLPMLSTAAPFFKCPFFQNSSQGLLHALSEEVVTLRHNSGESIIESHGKGSDCLFRVMEGTVAFVVGDKVIGTAENIWFGENSILTDKEMPLPIVIAVNSVETVSLSRKRFWKILRHFPREKKHYINLFQERVREGVIGEQAIVGSAEMRGEIGGQAVKRSITSGRQKELAPRTAPLAWAQVQEQKRWAAERKRLEDVDVDALVQEFAPTYGGETIDLRTALTRSRGGFAKPWLGGFANQLRPESCPVEHNASRRERKFTPVGRATRRVLTAIYQQAADELDGLGGFQSQMASTQTAQKPASTQLVAVSDEPQETSAESPTALVSALQTTSALETKHESDLERWFNSRSIRVRQQREETSWPSGGSFGPPESRPSTSPGTPYATRMRLESRSSPRRSPRPPPKPDAAAPLPSPSRGRRLALKPPTQERWTAFRSLVPMEETQVPATWPPYAVSSWMKNLG